MAFKFSVDAIEFVPGYAGFSETNSFEKVIRNVNTQERQTTSIGRPVPRPNTWDTSGNFTQRPTPWNTIAPDFIPKFDYPSFSQRHLPYNYPRNSANASFSDNNSTGTSNQQRQYQPNKGSQQSFSTKRKGNNGRKSEETTAAAGTSRNAQKVFPSSEVASKDGRGSARRTVQNDFDSKGTAISGSKPGPNIKRDSQIVREHQGGWKSKGSTKADVAPEERRKFDSKNAAQTGERKHIPPTRTWSNIVQSAAPQTKKATVNDSSDMNKISWRSKDDRVQIHEKRGSDSRGPRGRGYRPTGFQRRNDSLGNRQPGSSNVDNKETRARGDYTEKGHRSFQREEEKQKFCFGDVKARSNQAYKENLEWRRDSERDNKESFPYKRQGFFFDRPQTTRLSKDGRESLKTRGTITENYRYRNVTKQFSDRVKNVLLNGGAMKKFEQEFEDVDKVPEKMSRYWYNQSQINAMWGIKHDRLENVTKESASKDGFPTSWASLVRKEGEVTDLFTTHLKGNDDLVAGECKNCGRKRGNASIVEVKGEDCDTCRCGKSVLGKANRKGGIKMTDSRGVRSDVSYVGLEAARRDSRNAEKNQQRLAESSVGYPSSNDLRRKGEEEHNFGVDELIDLEQDHFEEYEGNKNDNQGSNHDEDDDDDDGWIVVEEKPKRKLKLEKMPREKEEAEKVVKGKRHLGRTVLVDKRERITSKSQAKDQDKPDDAVKTKSKDDKQNKPAKNESQKKSKKKKKTKRKEAPLYENDQKKIREYKMRQMIEENLKLNLLELTRTRQSANAAVHEEEAAEKEEWPSIGTAHVSTANILSFSEALKKKAPLKPQTQVIKKKQPGILEVDVSKLTEEEKIEFRRKQLKEKRKLKKKERKQRKRAEKEENGEVDLEQTSIVSKAITLDLGSMFDRLLNSEKPASKSSQSKAGKNVLFSAGVISVASGLAKKNNADGSKAESVRGRITGNMLDSTHPMKMSGKERETPKKRRPTMLKRAILRAREAKRIAREAKEKLPNSKCDDNAATTESKDKEGEGVGQENVPHGAISLQSDNEDNPRSKTDDDEDFKSNIAPLENHVEEAANPTNSALSDVPKEVISKLHTRKFREYCDHLLSKDIDEIVYRMLKDLQRFQTRAYVENPIKAKAKRRLVLGIREVARHLKMSRLKCVIIAPNLERVSNEGGIDSYLSKIIFDCKQFSIPVVYSMSRQALGMVLKRKVPVSAIGIFNYAGVEDDFKKLCAELKEQKDKYKQKLEQLTLEASNPPSDTQSSKRGSKPRASQSVYRPQEIVWNPDVMPFVPQTTPQPVMYNYYTSNLIASKFEFNT